MNRKRREALFRECADQHAGIVWRMAHAFARPEEAEDLSQEIWLQAWKSLPRFAGKSRISTWLYRVALHTGMTWRRRSRPPAEELAEQLIDETNPSPSEQGHSRDTREMLQRMLQRFPEADRALLTLWLEGLSYRETGEILGISESNVGVRLNRLKDKLKTFLKPYERELA